MMTHALRLTAALLLAISFAGGAAAKPPGGRGGGGGPPHMGGGHGGGGPHFGGGGPRIGGGGPHIGRVPHFGGGPRGGMHVAAPHGGPRGGAPHIARGPRGMHFAAPHGGPRIGMRHVAPRGLRALGGPRARFSRAARPAFSGRNALHDNAVRQSERALRQAPLRSAPAHARTAFRSNPAALGAFSGRTARVGASRAFRDPAFFARHRFDAGFLRRAGFAGAFWPGPYFWPYAYYDETFWLWPSAYDEMFWTYGYDDLLSGIYRPYAFSDYGDFAAAIGGSRRLRGARSAMPGNFAELCGAAAPGLTEWPLDDITASIEPTPQQRTLLDALIKASDKAAEALRAACPRSLPVTPIGRLDVMERQLAALEQAVEIVQPPLEKFYGSLSDDQKERFNALAPISQQPGRRRARTNASAAPQPERLARACQSGAAGPVDWPIGRIEDAVRPDAKQRGALDDLQAATTQAGKVLQSACPTELPLTPTGRLSAMQQRIAAIRQSIETLRPALAKFYAGLSDEQKARFNRALETSQRAG